MPRLILVERKQLGKLYHFTTSRSLLNILKSNTLYASHYPEMGQNFISMTRNKNFPLQVEFGKMRKLGVGLELDGDRLSDTFRIGPIDYFYREGVTSKGSRGLKGEKGTEVFEYEERVFLGSKTSIPNIQKYLLQIIIVPAMTENDRDFVALDDYIQDKGIPTEEIF